MRRPLYLRDRTPVPTEQNTGRAPELVWPCRRRGKSIDPARIGTAAQTQNLSKLLSTCWNFVVYEFVKNAYSSIWKQVVGNQKKHISQDNSYWLTTITKKIWWMGVDRIHLAKDRDLQQTLVKTVMNLGVLLNYGNLTSWTTISFSKGTPLHSININHIWQALKYGLGQSPFIVLIMQQSTH